MSNLYKTPESAPLKHTKKPLESFDKIQRLVGILFKTGLISLTLGFLIGLALSASTSWLSDIIATTCIGLGILLLMLCFTATIPLTIWGLIQGFTEAKKKK